MNYSEYRKKLLEIFNEAKNSKDEPNELTNDQRLKVDSIISCAELQKAVLTVLITSLLKKIMTPKQDVRLHQENLKNGYSGRSLDTVTVTPFMKEYYKRFSMAESGWLTRSLEQNVPYDKNYTGKISNKAVKKFFLDILEDIEIRNVAPYEYLRYIFIKLNERVKNDENVFEKLEKAYIAGTISIPLIIKMLKDHFNQPQSSRLPVLAIYSIYEMLINKVDTYNGKKLEILKSHTTADRYSGFGDIEIFDSKGHEYEGVEIKHGIPISTMMIMSVIEKIKGLHLKKYYILTTAEPNFQENSEQINDLTLRIKAEYDIDLIPNGIFPTVKYYLRFIDDYREYLNKYTHNLLSEYDKNTDIKEHHITSWYTILENHKLSTRNI